MAPESKPKMSSALMAMKFMRQGEALKKEEDEKLKKRQLEDSSRWTLRKIPKNSFSSIGIKSQETTNTPKKIVLETASFEDIYGQDSKKTNSSQQGRRAFGNFEKTAQDESKEAVEEDLRNKDEDFDIDNLLDRTNKNNKKREGSQSIEDQERYAKRRDFQVLRGLKSISGGASSAKSSSSDKKKKRKYGYDKRSNKD
ncbi:uncharacterized protein SAPINGB_P002034 [Magnusiomyces paraingens]|uniref:M-phase phosphoprotein 6 n=1 Tax=Magnusiomyces paraingens TaxID=2606893 RepID=A0A5E8BCE7_9ASCO|nr:uncharacterized protein SAPINGB_P002034 [Saprochaete ingens]VVT48957.1 unnamed protein product [Saprochaete ingens]